jgi:hypothetical protein
VDEKICTLTDKWTGPSWTENGPCNAGPEGLPYADSSRWKNEKRRNANAYLFVRYIDTKSLKIIHLISLSRVQGAWMYKGGPSHHLNVG